MFAMGVAGLMAVFGAGCVLLIVALDDFDIDVDFGVFGDDCDVNEEPIIAAAFKGHRREVERLLDSGVDPNVRDGDATALTCAAAGSHPEVVTLLLDRGATPTVAALRAAVGSTIAFGIPTPDSDTPPGREEVVRLLLEHGVDPNRGVHGPNPLLYAAWSGQPGVVDQLLAHGADPNRGGRVDSAFITMAQIWPYATKPTTRDGPRLPETRGDVVDNVPPLVGAVWTGQQDIATRLLDAGADPNLASDEAFTPIYAAAVRGDQELVVLLLARGASPTPTVRPDVATPAEAAEESGYPEIAAILTAASAPPPA